MLQNSTLKKINSYLCVIDTLKLRTCFLIMRHTITRARSVPVRVYARATQRSQVRMYVGLYVRKYKVYIL